MNIKIVFLVRELSELRALERTFRLYQLQWKTPLNWLCLVSHINNDFLDSPVINTILPIEIKIISIETLLVLLEEERVKVLAFENKFKTNYDSLVNAYLNFYEVASCCSYVDNYPLVKKERIVIGNLKVSSHNVNMLNDLLKVLSTASNYKFIIIPRHILSKNIMDAIVLPENAKIINKMGVLLSEYYKTKLVIHGNVFLYDDSEHNPFESASCANVIVNRLHCNKKEYNWLYNKSGLIHFYEYSSESFIPIIDQLMTDNCLSIKLTKKESRVKKTSLIYIQKVRALIYS